MEKISVNCGENSVISTCIPWHFKNADNQDINVILNLVKSERTDFAELSTLVQSYKDENGQISGKRIFAFCGENTVFITDLIKSCDSICVYTDFRVHNPDLTFSCNVAEKNKLVLRNKNCGIKHFRLLSEIDGTSVIDKAGLMMPYKTEKNGDILYSMYEGLHSHGKMHLACYGFCIDTTDRIIKWHFRDTQKGYSASTSVKKHGWEIELSENCVKIYKELECKGVFGLDQ